MTFELIFIFSSDVVSQHSRRSPSADFSHLTGANGLPDNTVKVTMTFPTQIRNQPLVSHMFLTFQNSTRQSFAASATARRVAATIHELQPIGGRRGCSFQKRGHSTQIDHLCSQAWHEFRPCLLRTTAAATTIARLSDASGLHHVSWPLPVQPTRPSHTPH